MILLLYFKKQTKPRNLYLCIQICMSTPSAWGQRLTLGARSKGQEGTTTPYIFVLLDYFIANKQYLVKDFFKNHTQNTYFFKMT